ncbi:MAG TPA: hypothetical protein VFD84_14745 [Candidatus Binatia bacterium]|jgi:hypothetical protein|nr:hypothetical protein [Candidatus Binatia bacterium]
MAHEQPDTGFRGFDAVAEALRGEDWPTDKQDLYYMVGDAEVEDGRGGWIAVRDILDRIARDEFATADDALAEIRRAVARARPA